MSSSGDHEHYEHYDATMSGRLDRAWGRVDDAINRSIARRVERGARVLDLGCGFGSLTQVLLSEYEVVGVDPLLFCVRDGKRRYPDARIVCGSATDLPFADASSDVAVLRDVLHHLADEAPVERVFSELERVGIQHLIIVDPNPNLVLRTARRLIGHVDPVCSPVEARRLLEEAGFAVGPPEHSILFSLPLSGGYVGPVLLPRWQWLWRVLLAVESGLTSLLDRVGLARHLCWRYTIVATR